MKTQTEEVEMAKGSKGNSANRVLADTRKNRVAQLAKPLRRYPGDAIHDDDRNRNADGPDR